MIGTRRKTSYLKIHNLKGSKEKNAKAKTSQHPKFNKKLYKKPSFQETESLEMKKTIR